MFLAFINHLGCMMLLQIHQGGSQRLCSAGAAYSCWSCHRNCSWTPSPQPWVLARAWKVHSWEVPAVMVLILRLKSLPGPVGTNSNLSSAGSRFCCCFTATVTHSSSKAAFPPRGAQFYLYHKIMLFLLNQTSDDSGVSHRRCEVCSRLNCGRGFQSCFQIRHCA